MFCFCVANHNCKMKNFQIISVFFYLLYFIYNARQKTISYHVTVSYKTHNVSDLHYFVVCFFFIHLPILVHAMDTTPIVKTIQNNGKFCYVFFRCIKKISFFVKLLCSWTILNFEIDAISLSLFVNI